MRKGMVVLALVILSIAVPVVSAVNSDPIAVAKISPTSCFACENETIRFDASDSYDLDGQIVKCEWNCNDKTITGRMRIGLANPFPQKASTYTVTLRVTDNGGATDEVEVKFYVKNNPRPQIKEISWEMENDGKDSLTLGNVFSVKVDLVDKKYGKIIYNWNYDSEVFQKIGNGCEVSFKVISAKEQRDYAISVTILNACGKGDTEEVDNIEVKPPRPNQPPEARITLPSTINEGERSQAKSASFTGQGKNEEGDKISWEWRIRATDKEGTVIETSERENPRFRIEDSGVFVIHLKVTDCFGAIGETSVPFRVEEFENDKPTANASATGTTAVHGELFKLDGSRSWDPDGPADKTIAEYIWYIRIQLKDGGSVLREICRSKSPVCSTTFNRTGKWKIVLEVIDAGFPDPLDNSVEFTITVIEPPGHAPTPRHTPTPRLTPEPIPTPALTTPPPPEKTKNIFWEMIEIIKTLLPDFW